MLIYATRTAIPGIYSSKCTSNKVDISHLSTFPGNFWTFVAALQHLMDTNDTYAFVSVSSTIDDAAAPRQLLAEVVSQLLDGDGVGLAAVCDLKLAP